MNSMPSSRYASVGKCLFPEMAGKDVKSLSLLCLFESMSTVFMFAHSKACLMSRWQSAMDCVQNQCGSHYFYGKKLECCDAPM